MVLPLASTREEIVLRRRALSILADDGSGTSWDPIKVEGEALVEVEGLEEFAAEGDEPADGEAADDSEAEAAPVAPELWAWDGTVPDHEVPPRDAYALRLVVGRRLYDNGRMVSEAAALARVRRPFALHVSPHDASALGVESGAEVQGHVEPRAAGRRRSRSTQVCRPASRGSTSRPTAQVRPS